MSPHLLALIPLAVGINLAFGQLAAVTHVPLFLDTVGTVLVAVLAGTGAALITGSFSQLVFTVVSGNFVWLWFLPVQLVVATFAGVAARVGVFRRLWLTLVAGLALGGLAATISWPISFFVFGGVTGGGVSAVVALFRGLGLQLGWAVYLGGLASDLLDKVFTVLVARTVLVSLPARLLARFPIARRALGQS